MMRRRAPGQAWTEIETGLAWPRSIVSVGHVALCFPPDDPVCGFLPGSGANGLPALGSLFLRGEAGALSLPLSVFTRLRSNPFFALIAASGRRDVGCGFPEMSIELRENGVPAQTPRVGNGGAQVIAAREALAVCFGS